MEWHCSNLIIVSGASGSGKSFFLKKLQKDNDSEFITSIFEEINSPRHNSFRIESIKKFLTSRRNNAMKSKKSCKTTFIHYDITGTRQGLKRDRLLEIIDKSDNVSIIILYTPYRYWRERMLKRQESSSSCKLPKRVRLILGLRFNSLMGILRYRNAYVEWQNFLNDSNIHKIWYIDSYLEEIFNCLPSDFSTLPFARLLGRIF
jgi:cytidylate kinase